MLKKNKILYPLLFILIFILALGTFSWFFKSKSLVTKNSNTKNLPPLSIEEIKQLPQLKNAKSSPVIYAKSALLIDVPSDFSVWSKNPTEALPIASTTKIMTYIIAEENLDSNKVVTIQPDSIKTIGTTMGLRVNENISIENLIKGLLIKSANDAALALADSFGRDQFVVKMNEKAKELGMKNTVYKDPAGLNDDGRSTARDLAIVTSFAFRKPNFVELIKTMDATVTSSDGKLSHQLDNSNRLLNDQEPLYYYQPANGVKTGFTDGAGHCLVASATQNSHTLFSIVLHTDENTKTASAKESKKLLEWGFNNLIW